MSNWPDQRPTPPGPPKPSWQYAEEDRASERAARLTVTCLAASFAVLVIGLVVFFTVRTLRQNDQAAPSPVVEESKGLTPEEAAKAVGGIGPPAGADVVTYGKARKEALAAATGDRIAVVSFWSYTTETKAKALAGEAEVMGLLAAAPGGQPAVVTGPLSAWVTSQTAEARAERDELTKLIPTVEDAKFKADYQARVTELAKLINSIKPTGDLVFGLVLRAPAPTLQALQNKAEIRIVDVGPKAEPDAKPIYRGLRPEEDSKANLPAVRPA